MKLNKLKLIISAIILSLLTYHILWFINYQQFSKPGGYLKGYRNYSKEVDNLIISYKPPTYPSFSGNYAVTSDKGEITIIVWPKRLFRNETRIGLMIYDEVSEKGYNFYVNQNLDYNEKLSNLDEIKKKEAQELQVKKKEKIKKFLKALERELEYSLELTK